MLILKTANSVNPNIKTPLERFSGKLRTLRKAQVVVNLRSSSDFRSQLSKLSSQPCIFCPNLITEVSQVALSH